MYVCMYVMYVVCMHVCIRGILSNGCVQPDVGPTDIGTYFLRRTTTGWLVHSHSGASSSTLSRCPNHCRASKPSHSSGSRFVP
jgi:hypothetical protein